MLKQRNLDHFYNSVALLGEFYNRLYKETHPILIMGQSLLGILTQHLHDELEACRQDNIHTIDDNFARLLLSQVGVLAFKSTLLDSWHLIMRKTIDLHPHYTDIVEWATSAPEAHARNQSVAVRCASLSHRCAYADVQHKSLFPHDTRPVSSQFSQHQPWTRWILRLYIGAPRCGGTGKQTTSGRSAWTQHWQPTAEHVQFASFEERF